MKAMALAAMAVWLAGAGAARGAEGPREIEVGKGVDGRLAGGGLDCYQVDAPKGKLAVSIKDAAFTPVVQLLRGVRCDAEVAQYEAEGAAGRAELPFASVGGRYLVVVRGKSAGAGGYHLSVDGAVPPAPVETAALDPALAAAEGLSPEARAALEASAPVAEAPPEPPVDPKVALMRKQLAAYKVEQAAEAARRAEEARQAEIRRQEEEEERERRQEQARIARQEEEANRQQMFNTFIQGVQMVTQSYVEAKTERREQQARLNELAAARDRANAEKAAAAQRAQQEQVNAQRAAQNAQLARQLAEANAVRDRMIAQSNDPAEKARLRAVNQQVVEIARQRGLDGELRQQQQAMGGGQPAQSSGEGGQDAARRAQEEQARAKDAERAKQEAAALKRQDDMRRQQEAAAKQQEEARKAQELAAKRQAEAQANARKQAWLADRASGGFSTVGLGAVDKGATPPGQGEMTHQIGHIGQCAATSITVRYRLGVLMGEPVVAGSWGFQGEDGCSPPHNTVVWLKLSNGAAYGWVRLDPGVPTANRGFGYNSPGSPNWGQLVCGFSGSGPAGCMSDPQARAMWANGQVVNFEVGW